MENPSVDQVSTEPNASAAPNSGSERTVQEKDFEKGEITMTTSDVEPAGVVRIKDIVVEAFA